MKLIVGLGNPGEKYAGTRHNLGFMTVDRVLQDFERVENTIWKKSEKVKSEIVSLDWQPKKGKMERVILAKPLTYMNNSGMAVSLLAAFYKVDAQDIWIVHDELDLPAGAMRIRFGGAGAGHHGIESIIENLGTDKFWRFRLGIGSEHPHSGRKGREDGVKQKIGRQMVGNATDYVLSSFGQEDNKMARDVIKKGAEAVSYALEKGLEKSMNRYNTK
jgi:PTH1 family peptidyl-tRNA hydrolase